MMKILMVTFNSKEIVCLALHNIFKNIKMSKNELIICDNSVEFQTSDMLKELGRKGYITYLDGVQDRSKRGSVNHRNGLLKCLEQCNDNEKVLILDCDAFPVSDIKPMMKRLKGNEKLIGAVHPRGYVHPSILAGSAGKIRNILLRENEMLAKGEKAHIDVFESYRIDENLIELKESIVSERVEELCMRNKVIGMMRSYNLGSTEFYHMWYYTRTNGYRIAVDGIDKDDLAIIRREYKNMFVMDISVIIPTYGINNNNFDALDKVVESLKYQKSQYRYDIWIALYNQDDLDISIDRDNFKGCNVHKIYDMKKWSRSLAFNTAFIALPYADKYVFHDRDILAPDGFIEEIGNSPYRYTINYRNIVHDESVMTDSVGGSNMITWDYMMISGGMCSRMEGWGGEDREFDYRVSMILDSFRSGRRLPMSLTHLSHAGDRKKPLRNQQTMEENMRMGKTDLFERCNYLMQDYRDYWATL